MINDIIDVIINNKHCKQKKKSESNGSKSIEYIALRVKEICKSSLV